MKIVVMDEARKRGKYLANILGKGNHSVICCHGSNDFMTNLSGNKIDRLLLDFNTWHNGRKIYSYFGIAGTLDSIPVITYNAPEGFPGIQGRPKHNKDKVLPRPTPVVSIVTSATAAE